MPQLTREEENEFFMQLGVFIAMTSIVEAHFTKAFRELLGVSEKVGRAMVSRMGRPTIDGLAGALLALAKASDFSKERTDFLHEVCELAKKLAKIRNMVAHQWLDMGEEGPTYTNAMIARAPDSIFHIPCSLIQIKNSIVLVGCVLNMLDLFMTGAFEKPEHQERIAMLRREFPTKDELPQSG